MAGTTIPTPPSDPHDPANLANVSGANAAHSAVHADADTRIKAIERTLTTGLPPTNAAALNKIEADWKAVQAQWATVQTTIQTLVGPQGPQGPQGPVGATGRSVVVTSGATKPATPKTGDVHVGAPVGGHTDVDVYDGIKWVSIDGKDGANGTNGTNGAKGDKGIQGDQGPQGNPFDFKGSTPIGSGAPTVLATRANVGEAWHEAGTRNLWISTWDYTAKTANWTHWIDALPAGAKGDAGAPGKSAYEIWQALGNVGTTTDFINALKVKGDQGDVGPVGPKGAAGETLKVQGVVKDRTVLPSAPARLTVMVTQNDSHLWIYDPNSPIASLGTTTGGAPTGWVDMQKIEGPPGPTGPRGQGVVQTAADLPIHPHRGESYLVLDTAEVMQWDSVSGWHSIGQPGIGALRSMLERELSRFATGISHGEAVQTFGENSPPVGARQDEYFIVGFTPTGKWAGHANELAWKTGKTLTDGTDEWLFARPDKGDTHMVEKDYAGSATNWANCMVSWTGTGWVKVGSMSAAALGAGSTVGMIAYFAKGNLPRGWLECNGATFDATTYPALQQHLGSSTLPDLRDQFFRARSSQALLSKVTGTTKKPTRGLDQVFARDEGNHNHRISRSGSPFSGDTKYGDGNFSTFQDAGTGNAVGGIIANEGNHWHHIDFRGDWDSETAPNHIYLVAAICALDAGREGVQGPPGLQGIAGPVGPAGKDGAAGETFKISGVIATPDVLPATPTHLTVYMVQSDGHLYIYDAASTAAITAAVAGAAGYKGAPAGYVDLGKVEGPKGNKGDAGTVQISGVTALATGATPTVVNTGTATDAILQIGIPTGPQGSQGNTGPAGPQGDAGQITSVSAITLPSASSATVQNTGTAEQAVLMFGIPQGADGPAGPQGPAGVDGETLTLVVAKGGAPSVTPPAGTTYSKGQLAVVLK